eukprot:TRINITY_DN19869_c0_g4_i1.p1 TRINITY_DN19869_c0_g4~~TRINITY_DN19869_c0_g4_i1.p1  ORF type:complete len:562 (-),score=88.41 TRINITY_DN19869_c0_g4_i1:311-1996(-)
MDAPAQSSKDETVSKDEVADFAGDSDDDASAVREEETQTLQGNDASAVPEEDTPTLQGKDESVVREEDMQASRGKDAEIDKDEVADKADGPESASATLEKQAPTESRGETAAVAGDDREVTPCTLRQGGRDITDDEIARLVKCRIGSDEDLPYTEVDLSRNALTSAGMPSVFEICRRCANLRILKLFGNKLDDGCAQEIERILQRCSKLEEVHLSHNALTQEGVMAIVKAAENRAQGNRPFWCRVEFNKFEQDEVVRLVKDTFSSVCILEDARCNAKSCVNKCRVHMPFLIDKDKRKKNHSYNKTSQWTDGWKSSSDVHRGGNGWTWDHTRHEERRGNDKWNSGWNKGWASGDKGREDSDWAWHKEQGDSRQYPRDSESKWSNGHRQRERREEGSDNWNRPIQRPPDDRGNQRENVRDLSPRPGGRRFRSRSREVRRGSTSVQSLPGYDRNASPLQREHAKAPVRRERYASPPRRDRQASRSVRRPGGAPYARVDDPVRRPNRGTYDQAPRMPPRRRGYMALDEYTDDDDNVGNRRGRPQPGRREARPDTRQTRPPRQTRA